MKQINNGKKNYLGSRYASEVASRAPVQSLLLLPLLVLVLPLPVLVVVVAVGDWSGLEVASLAWLH